MTDSEAPTQPAGTPRRHGAPGHPMGMATARCTEPRQAPRRTARPAAASQRAAPPPDGPVTPRHTAPRSKTHRHIPTDGHGKGHRREAARGNQRVLEAQGHRGPGGGLGARIGQHRLHRHGRGGAASIAEIAGTRASYVESRGKSEGYCQALVADYLKKHGTASRLEPNETVFPSLSSELTDSQKYDKVGNMRAKMRRSGTIVFDKRKSAWTLAQVLDGLREPTRYLRGHRLPDPALRNIRSTRPPNECPFNSR